MLTLHYPWLLVLLAVPLVLRRLAPPYREARPAVRVPFVERVEQLLGVQAQAGAAVTSAGRWQQLTQWVCWILLVVAACRPQWLEPPVTEMVPMRDLMLAVDLSGSMGTRDFVDASGQPVERLTAVKQVLDRFLAQRQGDRVGLIFFGSSPFLQVPFTEDLTACRELLEEAQVGMCGPKTALGDAIGLAMQCFARSGVEQKVLIALTDGNDTASQVPPIKAAEIAKDEQVTVYCVGVGDPQAAGEEKFDEATLEHVAQTTGGVYEHANNGEELTAIYAQLDRLEPRKVETISQRPRRELFYWPLAAFLIVSGLYHLGAIGRRWPTTHMAPARQPAGPQFVQAAVLLAVIGGASDWQAFHFLRPWWLAALAPAAVVVWLARRQRDALHAWRGLIDAPLLARLAVGERQQGRLKPLALLAALWTVAIVATAGPTWRREPSPFVEDHAALILVVECSPTMLAQDIQPSRMARAAEKIHDLLARRPGAPTALVAYADSPHLAMPLTTDAGAIDYFAAALSPEIMPAEGDRPTPALAMARSLLERSKQPGSILLITDGVSTPQIDAIRGQPDAAHPPVNVLAVAAAPGSAVPVGSPPAPPLDRAPLETVADACGGTLVVASPDDSDVDRLARLVETSWSSSDEGDTGQRWAEAGYWLLPIMLLLALPWFRRGWMVSYD